MKARLDSQIIVGKTESFFPVTRQNIKKGVSETEKVIFGEDIPIRVTTKGRPKINRYLARRLFQARFKPSQVASQLKCHVKTARRIRRELEENGELETRLRQEPMDIVQADFDEECEMATGYSFYEWMKNQTKSYSAIFNFCRRCWERESVWGKPSLVLTKDQGSQLGDQLCMKWLEIFRDDKKRIRYRKKWIRYLFRFLGRHDLCDRHLRMTKSRDPIPVRRIPEIELPNFPLHYEAAINEMAIKGHVYETAAKFKTVTQMRIGNRKEQRGLLGLRVGSSSRSYILMNGPDVFRCRVLEKRNEVWDITWIPKSIREALWEIYKSKKVGDPLFEIYLKEFRNTWKEAMFKHTGIKMVPHDSRKVSVTWLCVNDIPLEIATTLNVGWLDLNTPREHYLHMRRLLKNTQKAVYRENIPDWFKQGLDEYI